MGCVGLAQQTWSSSRSLGRIMLKVFLGFAVPSSILIIQGTASSWNERVCGTRENVGIRQEAQTF